MTRSEAKQWLIENLGIEEPNNAQVSALLNGVKSEVDKQVDTKVAEKVNEAVESERAKYSGFVSKDEHQATLKELTELKGANAKAERYAKFKAKGLKEKWFDLADSKLMESQDMDNDLAQFIADNPELVDSVSENNQANNSPFVFGNVNSSTEHKESPNKAVNDFIRGNQ